MVQHMGEFEGRQKGSNFIFASVDAVVTHCSTVEKYFVLDIDFYMHLNSL